jgi:DNA-binding NarL/FixJ family response regulator
VGRANGAKGVVVADDALLIREAVARIVERAPSLQLLASCADGDELLAAIEYSDPDVVVTDIRMPPSGTDEGIAIAHRLRETHPAIGVVVLSQFADPAFVLALFEAGSARRAYLLKERINDPQQLLEAIDAVAAGGSIVDPAVVELLVASHTPRPQAPLGDLTPRELEVLAQVAQGRSNAAIAESLVVTKRAVEKHINAIFSKLDLAHVDGISQRVAAALLFLSETRSRAAGTGAQLGNGRGGASQLGNGRGADSAGPYDRR